MAGGPALEHLLRRERIIALTAIAICGALAWLYVLSGAGMGMSAWQMTTLSLFPHAHDMDAIAGMPGMVAARMQWGFGLWLLMIVMWWSMMIAMMIPSAAPVILLYARVHHQAQRVGPSSGAHLGAFAAGYLLIWLAFSIAATTLHWLLQRSGLVAPMMMDSHSRWLSATVLIAAGLYQFSALKHACMAHCRAPATFLARSWRPGASGALRLGAIHGAFCVGCCWPLMTLLFVGGVMNLVWIGALAILVLVEKALRIRWLAQITGSILIAWGIATLAV